MASSLNATTTGERAAISLFSGMGGDCAGMRAAGLRVVAYAENNAAARVTHDRNFPGCEWLGSSVKGDVRAIKDTEYARFTGKVDAVFAGFPCQSFSRGGKRAVNDPRDTYFMEFARAVRIVRPAVAVGENVKGLLTKRTADGELFIDIIRAEFEALGYVVDHFVAQAQRFGVPQRRHRLFIVCVRPDQTRYLLARPPGLLVDPTPPPSLLGIVRFSMYRAMAVAPGDFDVAALPDECVVRDAGDSSAEVDPHPYLVLKRDGNKEYRGTTHASLFSFGKRKSPIHCEVVDLRKPTKTIICTYNHQPRLLVPVSNSTGTFLRPFTPDELKRIQGFAPDFVLTGTDKNKIVQIGNAVPPPLVTHVLRATIAAEQ